MASARAGFWLPISVPTMTLNRTAPPPHIKSRRWIALHWQINMVKSSLCAVFAAARLRAETHFRAEALDCRTYQRLAARTRGLEACYSALDAMASLFGAGGSQAQFDGNTQPDAVSSYIGPRKERERERESPVRPLRITSAVHCNRRPPVDLRGGSFSPVALYGREWQRIPQ